MKKELKKTAEKETVTGIITAALSKIVCNDFNPRRAVGNDELQELADSIKQVGVLQPILVRPKGKLFEIVCGERRYSASVLAGTQTIPAIVRTMSDDAALELAITENLQRKDISPIDEAMAYKKLTDTGRYDVAALAVRFGKSEKYIRSRMKLNDLIEEVLELVNRDAVTISVALELCKYDRETQADIYEKHLKNDSGYYENWRNLPLKEFVQRLERTYTNELVNYHFDKTPCQTCPFNTNCYNLFANERGQGKCTGLKCLQERNKAYLVTECNAIMKVHPDTDVCRHPYRNDNEDVFAEMTEQGHEVKREGKFEFFPEKPIEPRIEEFETEDEFVQAQKKYETDAAGYEEKNKAINEMLSAGKASWAVTVNNNRAAAGYFVIPEITGNTEKETAAPAEKLEKQDKRNREIAVENIVDDTRKHIRETEIPQSDFTEFEDTLLYFTMLDDLKREHFALFLADTQDKWHLSDEDKIKIINSLTEEQKTLIRRDFLVKRLSDAFGLSKKSYLMLEFARLHFPEEVAGTENRYNEVYQKRHERIAERLEALNRVEVQEVEIEVQDEQEAQERQEVA